MIWPTLASCCVGSTKTAMHSERLCDAELDRKSRNAKNFVFQSSSPSIKSL